MVDRYVETRDIDPSVDFEGWHFDRFSYWPPLEAVAKWEGQNPGSTKLGEQSQLTVNSRGHERIKPHNVYPEELDFDFFRPPD